MKFKCNECNAIYNKYRSWCKMCGADAICEQKQETFVDDSFPIIYNLADIQDTIRYESSWKEFDNVCGGGIVPGSALLLGGEPGMGKSTILLQLCNKFAGISLYCSGEENISQIQLRCKRLNLKCIKIVTDNNLESIIKLLENIKPQLIVIDSIQTLRSLEDLDIRAITDKLINICKYLNTALILVGHVTKSGELAGPKMLEHLVDAVLTLEGENDTRVLRATKNRFGSTGEIGIFKMTNEGIIEYANATQLFDEYTEPTIGSCIFTAFQGSRAIAVEVQALVNESHFQIPRRSVVGLCYNRLSMILAVIEKYTKISFYNKDVYLNVLNGFKVQDLAAADLSIVIAVLSSALKKAISPNSTAFGELTLIGKIRQPMYINERLKLIEKYQLKQITANTIKEIIELLR